MRKGQHPPPQTNPTTHPHHPPPPPPKPLPTFRTPPKRFVFRRVSHPPSGSKPRQKTSQRDSEDKSVYVLILFFFSGLSRVSSPRLDAKLFLAVTVP